MAKEEEESPKKSNEEEEEEGQEKVEEKKKAEENKVSARDETRGLAFGPSPRLFFEILTHTHTHSLCLGGTAGVETAKNHSIVHGDAEPALR